MRGHAVRPLGVSRGRHRHRHISVVNAGMQSVAIAQHKRGTVGENEQRPILLRVREGDSGADDRREAEQRLEAWAHIAVIEAPSINFYGNGVTGATWIADVKANGALERRVESALADSTDPLVMPCEVGEHVEREEVLRAARVDYELVGVLWVDWHSGAVEA